MTILFSNEILSAVKNELSNASNSIQIITAYCKRQTIELLDSYIQEGVNNKRLLVRFRLDDIVKGSTDYSILDFGLEKGWKVYIRFDLHAKTYVVDELRGIVGSANATGSGLGVGTAANMEMATLVNIEKEDVIKINNMFVDAIEVDDNVRTLLDKQFETVDLTKKSNNLSWDKGITDLFKPTVGTLFSHEFPDSDIIQSNTYIPFLDYFYDGDIEDLKRTLRWSRCYLWLRNTLAESGGELYFGAITERLHNSLVSDPKPYRKDVKILLSSLLGIIDKFQMDDIVIDRPNYSQRVRLKNN